MLFNFSVLLETADPNSILVRHKKFLKQLEKQKNVEREMMAEDMMNKEAKSKAFRDQAARQREKIKGLKGHDIAAQNEEAMAMME